MSKIYLIQNKETLTIHGCFDTREKAVNYTGGSERYKILELLVN